LTITSYVKKTPPTHKRADTYNIIPTTPETTQPTATYYNGTLLPPKLHLYADDNLTKILHHHLNRTDPKNSKPLHYALLLFISLFLIVFVY
jgi:hypothetical protein